jgi:hypothetical protein
MRSNEVTPKELAEARERNAARLKAPKKPGKPVTWDSPALAGWLPPMRGGKKHAVLDQGKLGPALAKRMPNVKRVIELNKIEFERVCNDKTGLTKYGMTRAEWKALVSEQDGCCAICGLRAEYVPSLAVDHCHKTGKVRGLLCRKCNTALGQLGDDPDRLRKAIEYLER